MVETLGMGNIAPGEKLFDNSIVCEWLGTEKAAAFLCISLNPVIHFGASRLPEISSNLLTSLLPRYITASTRPYFELMTLIFNALL